LNKEIIAFVLAAVLLQSCGAPKAIIREPVHTEGVQPIELIRKNNDNGRAIACVKAATTLDLESPKSANQFSAQLAIKFPDSVYIKIEGILGIAGLKASLNKETFVVYNIIDKYVVRGQTSANAIRKTFDYDISFAEMVELLAGLVRLRESELAELVDFSADDSYYVLTFQNDKGTRKVWIDPYANCAVSKILYYADNQLILQKDFTRFENISGTYMPRYVRVIRSKENDRLSLYFNSRTINKNFNSSLFTIKYPNDIRIIQEK
jgi:hypothetical protein